VTGKLRKAMTPPDTLIPKHLSSLSYDSIYARLLNAPVVTALRNDNN